MPDRATQLPRGFPPYDLIPMPNPYQQPVNPIERVQQSSHHQPTPATMPDRTTQLTTGFSHYDLMPMPDPYQQLVNVGQQVHPSYHYQPTTTMPYGTTQSTARFSPCGQTRRYNQQGQQNSQRGNSRVSYQRCNPDSISFTLVHDPMLDLWFYASHLPFGTADPYPSGEASASQDVRPAGLEIPGQDFDESGPMGVPEISAQGAIEPGVLSQGTRPQGGSAEGSNSPGGSDAYSYDPVDNEKATASSPLKRFEMTAVSI
ncbi:hypothetical protein F5B21DRAFT_335339 [Xylaria acuta]|nr:hypothetical protein F5B21DRAFT_335339 [Xylaria acuta]